MSVQSSPRATTSERMDMPWQISHPTSDTIQRESHAFPDPMLPRERRERTRASRRNSPVG